MSVEKSALRKNNHKRGLDREIEEKLYYALRAEHGKVRQLQREQLKKQLEVELRPTSSVDLEGKEEVVTRHLRYAYNGFEVSVTPRKHRRIREEQGRDGRAEWREKELTPDRALRKMREEIKRRGGGLCLLAT